jgi:hypothetical protein
MRNEAPRTGRRRQREAKCVRRARTQSCRPVGRAGKCQRERLRDRARCRGEGSRDYRGGAWH